MGENQLLQDASVQDIQLELIRRSRFNAFDGERVHAWLLNHGDLWTAVLLDRPGHSAPYGSSLLQMSGLIKLRDLSDNIWNADTLYILTPSHDAARELGRRLTAENLGDEVTVHEDRQEIGGALGTYGDEYGLVTVWWD